MNTDPIIVEATYAASAAQVWKAITEVDQMKQWFFPNIPNFKAEVGFKTQFMVQAPSRGFLHIWTITDAIPNQKIAYDWEFGDFEGVSNVSFDIFEKGDNTMLRVTAQINEKLPTDIPEFKRESGVGGWTYFLQDALKKYLEN